MSTGNYAGFARKDDHEPLRFPIEKARFRIVSHGRSAGGEFVDAGGFDTGDGAIDALEQVSRKIQDLARALNCLGYFDDEGDDDRPRAA